MCAMGRVHGTEDWQANSTLILIVYTTTVDARQFTTGYKRAGAQLKTTQFLLRSSAAKTIRAQGDTLPEVVVDNKLKIGSHTLYCTRPFQTSSRTVYPQVTVGQNKYH